MKKAGNKNLKLIAFTGMTIFSLFSVFMGTIAWFAMNRVVNSNGADINVEHILPIFSQVQVYTQGQNTTNGKSTTTPYCFYNTIDGASTMPTAAYSYQFLDKTSTGTMPELGTFDTMQAEQSLLYLFKVDEQTDANSSFSITAKTDTTKEQSLLYTTSEMVDDIVTTTVVNKLHPTDVNDQHTNTQQSSIVRYYMFTLSEEPDDISDFDYSSSYSSMPRKQFVDVSSDILSFDYSSEIELYHKNEQDNLPKYVGMILTYNKEAFEAVYTLNLGNYAIEREDNVLISCDWHLEIG